MVGPGRHLASPRHCTHFIFSLEYHKWSADAHRRLLCATAYVVAFSETDWLVDWFIVSYDSANKQNNANKHHAKKLPILNGALVAPQWQHRPWNFPSQPSIILQRTRLKRQPSTVFFKSWYWLLRSLGRLVIACVIRAGFKPIWPISSNWIPGQGGPRATPTNQHKSTLSIEAACV